MNRIPQRRQEKQEKTDDASVADRRLVLKGVLATIGAISVPLGNTAEAVEGLESLERMSVPEKLDWFAQKLGPRGSLWPRIREGNFSDKELKSILRAMADIAEGLNTNTVQDRTLQGIRERLPRLEDVPHMYTVAIWREGKFVDVGNAQIYQFDGLPYIQTSMHLIEGLSRFFPDVLKYFRTPSIRAAAQPDIAYAALTQAPITDDADRRLLDVPTDFDPRACHGQINTIIGYKDDGGIDITSGVVWPTPPKMLARLWKYWGTQPGSDAKTQALMALMHESGLMLVPSYFSEYSPEGQRRGAGRSGSLRLVYSPPHREFVPASNFAAISGASVHGWATGWVDSMTHNQRGLTQMRDTVKSGRLQSMSPSSYAHIEKGAHELIPGVYLRSVRHRVARVERPARPEGKR